MEIKYLKLMQKTPKIDETYNIGVSEELIGKIELKLGYSFPAVYKEFLFLGGQGANMIADMNHQVQSFYDGVELWQELQQDCREEIERENVKIDSPFWAFADLDGGEQFHFFYLDEGDDPLVHYYCSYHWDDEGNEYAGVEPTGKTFSEFIIRNIKNRKRDGY